MTDDEKRELKHGYVTLKEHFDMLLIEREKRILDKFAAEQERLAVAKDELERRLEALNELRATVEKDRDQFVKNETYLLKTAWYDEWCRGVDKKLAYWSAAIVVLVFLIEMGVKLWR